MMTTKNTISFTLNGKPTQANCRPDTPLLEWLRTGIHLNGTKEGCAEGDCGACTVLMSKPDTSGYAAVNSCILSMGQIEGRSLMTVEGLSAQSIHPIQDAMAQNGSSQCGFCTPGIVVSLAGLLSENASPSEDNIHDALAGNLCRCTGYKPIIEAAKAVAKTGLISLPSIESIHAPASAIDSSGSVFHRPATLKDFFVLRVANPSAVIVSGATDLGVALAEHETEWPVALWTGGVKELRAVAEDATHWHFGAAVTWSEILGKTADAYPSLAVLLRRFGSAQIRNMGTIGGNIGTASPIGDGPPALIALGAKITLASARSEHSMPLEDFFIDYRKTALREDEIIKSVSLPKPVAGQHFRVWKISKRYDQDISTVCGAFNLMLKDGRIASARVAFGGMAAIPRRVPTAENELMEEMPTSAVFAKTAAAIRDAFKPLSDWRGTSEYRTEVAGNLALRLGAELAGETVEVMA
ncbi:MAG: xanthine dehydrogenase small subunit [Rhizobiaceae bacterium]